MKGLIFIKRGAGDGRLSVGVDRGLPVVPPARMGQY